MDAHLLYAKLLLPLLRLVATMCIGLLAASLLESLHWTRCIARLASPLARFGHLREMSAASFALAFFSPAASHSLLAEAYAGGGISRREVMFANLFNSSPTFLVHLPTMFSLVFAFLGAQAFVYVGLCFAASMLRTLATVGAGRLLLPPPEAAPPLRRRSRREEHGGGSRNPRCIVAKNASASFSSSPFPCTAFFSPYSNGECLTLRNGGSPPIRAGFPF